MSTDSPIRALKRAVDAAGSQSALARAIGVTQASIWRWLNDVQPTAAESVLKIEAATGVSRHDLRPDIYPRDDAPVSMEPVR